MKTNSRRQPGGEWTGARQSGQAARRAQRYRGSDHARGHGDLALTARLSRGSVRFSAHAGETAIFVARTRYFADHSPEERRTLVGVVRDELARLTVGQTATERGEGGFTRQQLDALRRLVDSVEPACGGRYRSSRDHCELAITPTVDGLGRPGGRRRRHAINLLGSRHALQLLAGMIWRSCAEPGDDFSPLSRVPTIEYLTAIQAAEQTS